MKDRLQHQIDYYRARAPEYDDWFYRRGRYDHGEAHTRQWQREAKIVREQLRSQSGFGRILELAPGTGIWTEQLINIGERVTALDASPEMIAINRAKLRSDRVDYHQVDLFQWQPVRQYDMVFFGFWLSHVPAAKLDRFLDSARAALKPGGRLFLVDSCPSEKSTSAEQSIETENELQGRFLRDGRRYTIIKIYYEPLELTATLHRHGFDIEVQSTESSFLYADGRRAP